MELSKESMTLIAGAAQALGTWVLVIAGWVVVNDQNRHQEMNRANHVRLESLRRILDELEQNALEIHISAYNESSNRRIRRLLKKLAIDCKLLAERGALDAGWLTQMIQLRKAITLQNFDKSTFEPQEPGSPVLATIETAKDNFDAYIGTCAGAALLKDRSIWKSFGSVVRR